MEQDKVVKAECLSVSVSLMCRWDKLLHRPEQRSSGANITHTIHCSFSIALRLETPRHLEGLELTDLHEQMQSYGVPCWWFYREADRLLGEISLVISSLCCYGAMLCYTMQ